MVAIIIVIVLVGLYYFITRYTRAGKRFLFRWTFGTRANNNIRALTWLVIDIPLLIIAFAVCMQWLANRSTPKNCVWRATWARLPSFLKEVTRVCPENIPSTVWFSGWTVFGLLVCVLLFVLASLVHAVFSQREEVRRKWILWRAHRTNVQSAGQNPVAPPSGLSERMARKTFWASAAVALVGDAVVDILLRRT